MNTLMIFVFGGAVGAGAAWMIAAARRRGAVPAEEAADLRSQLAVLRSDVAHSKEERDRVALAEAAARERIIELERTKSGETAQRQALDERLKAQREDVEKTQKAFTEKFENLANEILRDSAKQLQESSEKGLQTILGPLKEKLTEFQGQVSETYSKESRERMLLQSEIERIILTNQTMTQETTNLTRALKGDSQTQGDWGEFVLEKILEASGLRKGEEFVRQGKEMGLKDDDGGHKKPDIVVNLPEDKHLIIDSKVSLTAYERYINLPDPGQGIAVLKELHTSVYNHIDELHAQHYDSLDKLRSPDFVIMFIPTEGVFSTMVRTDKGILPYAWEKRVAIVSPSTLLATLLAVSSIWKSERQNKNSLEIVKHAGLLYDRFVDLTKHLTDIGKALGTAQKSYDGALDKITNPSLGITRKFEDLRELGAKAKKKMDPKFLLEAPEPEEPAAPN